MSKCDKKGKQGGWGVRKRERERAHPDVDVNKKAAARRDILIHDSLPIIPFCL
jgi:hypothetical protein